MKCLIITDQQRADIDALNARSPLHKITPIQMEDGTWILNEDVLTEIGKGKLFADFHPVIDPIGKDAAAKLTIDRESATPVKTKGDVEEDPKP